MGDDMTSSIDLDIVDDDDLFNEITKRGYSCIIDISPLRMTRQTIRGILMSAEISLRSKGDHANANYLDYIKDIF